MDVCIPCYNTDATGYFKFGLTSVLTLVLNQTSAFQQKCHLDELLTKYHKFQSSNRPQYKQVKLIIESNLMTQNM